MCRWSASVSRMTGTEYSAASAVIAPQSRPNWVWKFAITIGVVSGDAIAGEANLGTLRYLLVVPVSRDRLLAVKTAAIAAFTAMAVTLVAVVGLVAGAALFGLHSLVLLSGDTVSLGSGLLRTLGVIGYVSVALFGLAAIGVMENDGRRRATLERMYGRSCEPPARRSRG